MNNINQGVLHCLHVEKALFYMKEYIAITEAKTLLETKNKIKLFLRLYIWLYLLIKYLTSDFEISIFYPLIWTRTYVCEYAIFTGVIPTQYKKNSLACQFVWTCSRVLKTTFTKKFHVFVRFNIIKTNKGFFSSLYVPIPRKPYIFLYLFNLTEYTLCSL